MIQLMISQMTVFWSDPMLIQRSLFCRLNKLSQFNDIVVFSKVVYTPFLFFFQGADKYEQSLVHIYYLPTWPVLYP